MAYSCDGFGIYEARSERDGNYGTTVFSRPIQSDSAGIPSATTNTSGWSSQCGATQYFTAIQESTGDAVEPGAHN